MADVTDVVSTIVGIVSGIVYPNGTSQGSVCGVDARVFAGWPIPDTLAADLAAGRCEISVYPLPAERNTTRFALAWQTTFVNTPTLTLSAAGQTVTVGGVIPPISNPHNAVVFVNNVPYVYAVQPADTLSSVAAALATRIAVAVPGTTSFGAVITLPSSARLGAVRIGVTGTNIMEVRRQEKLFQIVIWADSPAHRRALANAIDPALAVMTRITLSDLTGATMLYKSNSESDIAQKQKIYRRDLLYTVEYATTQSEIATQVTQTQVNVSVDVAGVPPPVQVATLYD